MATICNLPPQQIGAEINDKIKLFVFAVTFPFRLASKLENNSICNFHFLFLPMMYYITSS